MSAAIRHRTAGLTDRVERLEAVAEAAEHAQAAPGCTAMLRAILAQPDGIDAVRALAARLEADALTADDLELLANVAAPADEVRAYIAACGRVLGLI